MILLTGEKRRWTDVCAKSKQGMTEHEKEKQPIAVCSFIGHEEVYDADLEHRLQTVVEQIIEYHETVEFLIYPRGRFYYLCTVSYTHLDVYKRQPLLDREGKPVISPVKPFPG